MLGFLDSIFFRNQKLGNLAKSYAAYERAISLQPQTVTAWQGVVELYKSTNEYEILKKHLLELLAKFVQYVYNTIVVEIKQ